MYNLYLLTFNAARNLVQPDALAPALFDALPASHHLPDILAVSLQEIAPIAFAFLGGSYLDPYYSRIAATVKLGAKLRTRGSDTLEHVATQNIGMTALMIFAKPRLVERIHSMQSASVGLGLWNMGNKGAVAFRFRVDESAPMTFVAAHFAPMESNIEARNRDWEQTVRNLAFVDHVNAGSGHSAQEAVPLLSTASEPSPPNGLFASGSYVFFAGDLNYRTHDKPPGPHAYQTYPQPGTTAEANARVTRLLKTDQLTREKELDRTLHGLSELPITFPPTYKYATRAHKRSVSDPDDHWYWAKHRYPSWCDRILFFPSPSYAPSIVVPGSYVALPVQSSSDHRPVALSLQVKEGSTALNFSSPFPLSADWKARQNAARRLEIVVAILSYLALTKKGNAIIVAIAGAALASWWMAMWLRR
ncbi:DNase I-like protein [Polyplosphaeria fusca]|uniref:DNase I-like protein n=1 Tax=Polyplosphaeria fusca TaxID=682080 RepID=A0A9P4QN46_9PLEO|nr:DNase I-like protein [Polyplosphaeria fusca]